MKVLILTNGNGTRMQPLSRYLNKTMVPINGKPILEYVIEHLMLHDITDIVLAVGVKHRQIINYFGNGDRWGIKIVYSISPKPMGTAGELSKAVALFKTESDFLIYYGDTLTNTDLWDFYDYHLQCGGVITLNGIEGLPLETGVIIQDNGKVTDFQEKPIYPVLTNVPIFFCSNAVLESENVCEGKDFSRDVFPEFIQRGKVFVYSQQDNYHYDVGNMDRLEKIAKVYGRKSLMEKIQVIK